MPVLNQMVTEPYLEEYNMSTVDMGSIGNQPLQQVYYDEAHFTFTDAYVDFLRNILGEPYLPSFGYDFPKVTPDK